ATFPVFVRWFGFGGADKDKEEAGRNAGRSAGLVYWMNTAGAVCGVLAAGFFLVERLGMGASYKAAAAANLVCALLALAISRWGVKALREGPPAPVPARAPGFLEMTGDQAAACALLFISGYAALAAQLAWSRSLALVIGSSTYAFTVILAVFLLGLSSGGGLAGFVFGRRNPGWGAVAAGALAAAGGLCLSLSIQNYLPLLLTRLYPFYFSGKIPLAAIHLLLAALSIFPAAACMGFLYPALMGAGGAGGAAAGREIGRYTAVNTLGCIAGALAAGFSLIPRLGIERTLVLAALLYLLAGLAALYLSRAPRRLAWLILAPALAAAALLAYPKWDPWALSSGAYLYTHKFRGVKTYGEFLARAGRDELRILLHKDGAFATVTVLDDSDRERFLRVNGKSDASNNKVDMGTQLLLAYVPRVLLAGDLKSALVVGLGSGVTAGALAAMPEIREVDCVEIEPEVERAAALFSGINKGVLDSDKFKLVRTDARHFLTGSRKSYDLILSEPSNPWMAGVASLFTREAFSLAKARLSPGGIFCQWMHDYSMSPEDFRMVVNTFASVFPHMMLFSAAGGDYLLVGSPAEITPDYARVRYLLGTRPEMLSDLASLGLGDPFVFLAATFLLDDAAARAYAEGAPLHADDRMTLEFSAPRHLHDTSGMQVELSIARVRHRILPDRLANFSPKAAQLEELYLRAGEAAMGVFGVFTVEPFFHKVLEASPGNPRALTGLGRAALLVRDMRRAEEYFKKATESAVPHPPAYLALGGYYAVSGQAEKALDCLEAGVRRIPGDPGLTLALAEFYEATARPNKARELLKRLAPGSFRDRAQLQAFVQISERLKPAAK
ncbi:MAG: hypothetical protein A3J79_12495, partial [Elusimicrobia bacterium RIFOXYB2_FULL_62_6]